VYFGIHKAGYLKIKKPGIGNTSYTNAEGF